MKNKHLRLLTLFIVFILSFSLIACQKAPSAGSGSTGTEQTQLPTEDRQGSAIKIPQKVDKIISMAPSTTQIIDDLGLSDKLVAVDTQSPLYVNDLEELPQFDMMQPDIEKIAELEPDIVFVSGMSSLDGDPFAALKDMGICVASIPSSSSIDEIKKDVQFVADALSKSEKGKKLVAGMEKKIDEIAAIGKKIKDKKTVLFEIAAFPDIYSFGSGTFLNDILDLIGAENVFAKEKSWIAVNPEDAIAANPDVILTSVNYIDDPVSEILNREGWESVEAVANKEVYYIDNGASSLPNHHIVDAMDQMAKSIYPEYYK